MKKSECFGTFIKSVTYIGGAVFFAFAVGMVGWGAYQIWYGDSVTSVPNGSALVQAGGVILAMCVTVSAPIIWARDQKVRQERAQLLRTLAIAKKFFSDFDKLKKYFSTGATHLNQEYSAPRNWGFFHDSFRNLSMTGDASFEAQVLVDTLYEAAFSLILGCGSLQFKHGLMVESTQPLYQEYVRCKDSVEEARTSYENLMKIAHPSLSPREPNNASEPPPSSSSQPSSPA